MERQLILNGTPLEELVGFARAVRVGPHISVAGTAPIGPDGETVGVGDVARQAERCFEIVGDALNRAGAGWRDVVRTRLLFTDVEDWKKVVAVRKKFCGEAKPVATIMQVSRFVDPEWLIEIEVDAIVSDL